MLFLLFFIFIRSALANDSSIINSSFKNELTTFSFNSAGRDFIRSSNFIFSNFVFNNFVIGPFITIDYINPGKGLLINQYGARFGLRNILNNNLLNFKADLRYLISSNVFQSYQVLKLTEKSINIDTLSIIEISNYFFWYTFNQVYRPLYKDIISSSIVFGHTLNNSLIIEEYFIGPGIRLDLDSSDILVSLVFGKPDSISIVAYLNMQLY